MQISLSLFSEKVTEQYDLTLMMCSFEQRSLSLISHAKPNQLGIVIVIYNEGCEACIEQLARVHDILGERGLCIPVKLDNPLEFADKLMETLREYSNVQKLLIDVTTFSHEALLILIRLSETLYPNAKIMYAYSNAKHYSSNETGLQKWLSKGIRESRSVLGFPGEINPCNRDRLLVIVGYEFARTIAAIENIEPTELTLAYGKPEDATTEEDKEANIQFAELVCDMAFAYPNIDKIEIPCNDPIAAAKHLVQYVRNQKDENIIILPMNNKLTTIAVEFVQRIMPSIQVCYVPAEVYNTTNYSDPGEYVYFGELQGEGLEEELNEIRRAKF